MRKLHVIPRIGLMCNRTRGITSIKEIRNPSDVRTDELIPSEIGRVRLLYAKQSESSLLEEQRDRDLSSSVPQGK